ncbi:MAG: ThuA domain-containing protein [Chloroflexota bacterium]
MPAQPTRVLVWSERSEPAVVYPRGINGAIAEQLQTLDNAVVRTADLNQPDQGLSEDLLSDTDVLIWWGHARHRDLTDETVARVTRNVRQRGMGLIPLHSSHHSRVFKALLGTSCDLGGWREDGKPVRYYVIEPDHPIAAGLDASFVIPEDEMYSERFDVPAPDQLVFIASYAGGEVFRAGCCWTVGQGRVFYFSAGHETHAIFQQPVVATVLRNAVAWASNRAR